MIAGAWLMVALAMGSPPPTPGYATVPWNGPRAILAQAGDVTLSLTVTPAGPLPAGSELTYAMRYMNTGSGSIGNVVIHDLIPAFTQFKVGSARIGVPPSSVASITPQYSSDGGATWTYAPVSGGGGAPPSFDANVTHVRFVLVGLLPPGIAPPVGVSFTVRIRD